MAKKKHHTIFRRSTTAIDDEGRKQCFIMYGASAIVLWKYHSRKQLAISRLFKVSREVWHECTLTNEKSMIQMCEQETGIEIRNESGKSWRDLPYLNGSLDPGKMTGAQWVYMRQQQVKWVAPQIMACIMIALHRKWGFGFDRCARFYSQVEEVKQEFGGDPMKIQTACLELTGINVMDTVMERRAAD